MSCVDQIPEWIKNYRHFQEMPLRTLANVARVVAEHGMTRDLHETAMFLAARYWVLQRQIDELRAASASGSKVLLVREGETACAR